jgi:hypothetical protein
MPVPKSKLRQLDEAIDNWLRRDSKDEPPRSPLNAPKQFQESPSSAPKPDQELWPPKPRVPVPIETL